MIQKHKTAKKQRNKHGRGNKPRWEQRKKEAKGMSIILTKHLQSSLKYQQSEDCSNLRGNLIITSQMDCTNALYRLFSLPLSSTIYLPIYLSSSIIYLSSSVSLTFCHVPVILSPARLKLALAVSVLEWYFSLMLALSKWCSHTLLCAIAPITWFHTGSNVDGISLQQHRMVQGELETFQNSLLIWAQPPILQLHRYISHLKVRNGPS